MDTEKALCDLLNGVGLKLTKLHVDRPLPAESSDTSAVTVRHAIKEFFATATNATTAYGYKLEPEIKKQFAALRKEDAIMKCDESTCSLLNNIGLQLTMLRVDKPIKPGSEDSPEDKLRTEVIHFFETLEKLFVGCGCELEPTVSLQLGRLRRDFGRHSDGLARPDGIQQHSALPSTGSSQTLLRAAAGRELVKLEPSDSPFIPQSTGQSQGKALASEHTQIQYCDADEFHNNPKKFRASLKGNYSKNFLSPLSGIQAAAENAVHEQLVLPPTPSFEEPKKYTSRGENQDQNPKQKHKQILPYSSPSGFTFSVSIPASPRKKASFSDLAIAFKHPTAMLQFIGLVRSYKRQCVDLIQNVRCQEQYQSSMALFQVQERSWGDAIFTEYWGRHNSVLFAEHLRQLILPGLKRNLPQQISRISQDLNESKPVLQRRKGWGNRLFDACGGHWGLLPFLPLPRYKEANKGAYSLGWSPQTMSKADADVIRSLVASWEWTPYLCRIGRHFQDMLAGNEASPDLNEILRAFDVCSTLEEALDEANKVFFKGQCTCLSSDGVN